MAPRENISLPLRWEFTPMYHGRDGTTVWIWRAYRQSGELAMESKTPFDTFTECVEDAERNGYLSPERR